METVDPNPPTRQAKIKPEKPLGHRAYGSIPHLPGSRRGPADKGLSEQQARILTQKARDKYDLITVEEKIDGSNVAVANINGEIIALMRAGYRAIDSKFIQHHHFARWVEIEKSRFEGLLKLGERCVGEWLMEAHGTRYNLPHEPFVIFDIMQETQRSLAADVRCRCSEYHFVNPRIIHVGGPISISEVMTILEPSGHGAIDKVEGAVWRCERKGVVDFLGKYVRPDKVDGCYLESQTGDEPIFNWKPSITQPVREVRFGTTAELKPKN